MRINFNRSVPSVKAGNTSLDPDSNWMLQIEKSKKDQSLEVSISNTDKLKANFCYHSLAVFLKQEMWAKSGNQFLAFNYSLYIYVDPLNGVHDALKVDVTSFGKLPLVVFQKQGILHLVDRNTDIVLNSIWIS